MSRDTHPTAAFGRRVSESTLNAETALKGLLHLTGAESATLDINGVEYTVSPTESAQ